MSTAEKTPPRAALEISCAKPGCHWKGSPADAPNHPCPTPAADAPTVLADHADVAERDKLFASLDDAGVRYDRGTSTEGLRELVALTTGQVTEPPPLPAQEGTQVLDAADDAPPAYESDPKTKDEIEAWLLEHGKYDSRGVPEDEKTATLDAHYATFADEPALEDDDEEPETLPIAAEAATGFAETPAGVDVRTMDEALSDADAKAQAIAEERAALGGEPTVTLPAGPRAWETVIAAALEEQTAVKEYRWLIIWKPEDATREAELIGRAKIKNEAVVIQEDVTARGELTGEIVVAKTADVLQAAAEIEKKRELVEEPATVIEEADDDGETQPAEEESPGEQTASVAAPAPPPPGGKPALFNASDYDRADLALPQVDGHPVDRIAVKFGGTIMLDRSDPDHVALWRRLKLGRKTELWVEAKGLGWSGAGATNKDGELDVVVGQRSVTVTSVRILGPEDLGNAAAEVAAQARDALEAQNDREAAAAADAD